MPAARPSIRSSSPASALVVSATYEDLLRHVRAVLFTSRQNIEDAWLMMFHDIGRLIHEHVLFHEARPKWGHIENRDKTALNARVSSAPP